MVLSPSSVPWKFQRFLSVDLSTSDLLLTTRYDHWTILTNNINNYWDINPKPINSRHHWRFMSLPRDEFLFLIDFCRFVLINFRSSNCSAVPSICRLNRRRSAFVHRFNPRWSNGIWTPDFRPSNCAPDFRPSNWAPDFRPSNWAPDFRPSKKVLLGSQIPNRTSGRCVIFCPMDCLIMGGLIEERSPGIIICEDWWMLIWLINTWTCPCLYSAACNLLKYSLHVLYSTIVCLSGVRKKRYGRVIRRANNYSGSLLWS